MANGKIKGKPKKASGERRRRSPAAALSPVNSVSKAALAAALSPPKPQAPKAKSIGPPPGRYGLYGFSVPEAGGMIGLSPASSYKAAHAGEIPTVKAGALLIVPRVKWLKMLGFEGVEEPNNSIDEPLLATSIEDDRPAEGGDESDRKRGEVSAPPAPVDAA